MTNDQKIPEGWNPLDRWAKHKAELDEARRSTASVIPQVWTPEQEARIRASIERWQDAAMFGNPLFRR